MWMKSHYQVEAQLPPNSCFQEGAEQAQKEGTAAAEVRCSRHQEELLEGSCDTKSVASTGLNHKSMLMWLDWQGK
jgi:hypothetical protein